MWTKDTLRSHAHSRSDYRKHQLSHVYHGWLTTCITTQTGALLSMLRATPHTLMHYITAHIKLARTSGLIPAHLPMAVSVKVLQPQHAQSEARHRFICWF